MARGGGRLVLLLFDFELSEAGMAYISGLAWFMAAPGENIPHVADVLEIGQVASH